MKKEILVKWISMLIIFGIIYCYFKNNLIWLSSLFIVLGCISIIIKNPFSIFFILFGSMLLSFFLEKRMLFVILILFIIIIAVFDSIQLIKLMIGKKSFLLNNKEAIIHLKKNGITNKICSLFHNNRAH